MIDLKDLKELNTSEQKKKFNEMSLREKNDLYENDLELYTKLANREVK